MILDGFWSIRKFNKQHLVSAISRVKQLLEHKHQKISANCLIMIFHKILNPKTACSSGTLLLNLFLCSKLIVQDSQLLDVVPLVSAALTSSTLKQYLEQENGAIKKYGFLSKTVPLQRVESGKFLFFGLLNTTVFKVLHGQHLKWSWQF